MTVKCHSFTDAYQNASYSFNAKHMKMAHLLRKLQKCRSVGICRSNSTELYCNKYGINQQIYYLIAEIDPFLEKFTFSSGVFFPNIVQWLILHPFWEINDRRRKTAFQYQYFIFYINARNRRNYLLFIKKIHKKPSKNHLRMFSVSHLALSNSSLNFKMKPSTHPPN